MTRKTFEEAKKDILKRYPRMTIPEKVMIRVYRKRPSLLTIDEKRLARGLISIYSKEKEDKTK